MRKEKELEILKAKKKESQRAVKQWEKKKNLERAEDMAQQLKEQVIKEENEKELQK